jgi:predicted Ser/Thr protein kinase
MLFSDPACGRLSAEEEHLLQARLAEFDRDWGEHHFLAALGDLPSGSPSLRRALLVGLARLDLHRRWQRGQRMMVEDYLLQCPELGTRETAPLGLVHAEVEARLWAGESANLDALAQRFPLQTAQIKKGLTQSITPDPPSAAPVTPSDNALKTPLEPDTGAPPLPSPFGRYVILRLLGKGGMGSVYLAHDRQLERRVALKVPHLRSDDRAVPRERFFREARAAARVEHPGICPVHDVGEIDGVPYLTMAYLEGRPLSSLLRAGMSFSGRQAAFIVWRVALALAEAHDHGITHCDLKPSNIMLGRQGAPVLMDFGLARCILSADESSAAPGTILGTPAYVSPEVLDGGSGAAGAASDVYSLGVILYELLTRRVPFDGSMRALTRKITRREPPPVSAYRADAPPVLEEICRRAMARRPADRYPSMRPLAAALHAYLSGENQRPVPPALEGSEEGRLSPEAETELLFLDAAAPSWEEASTEEWAGRYRWRRLLALASGVLAVLLAAGFLALVLAADPDAMPDIPSPPAGAEAGEVPG